jgi:hypothetical protein
MSEERDPWWPDDVESEDDVEFISEELFTCMIGMIASTKRQNGSQHDAWALVCGLRNLVADRDKWKALAEGGKCE